MLEDDVSSVSWGCDVIVVSKVGFFSFLSFALGSLWARVASPFLRSGEDLVAVSTLWLEDDRLLAAALDQALTCCLVEDIPDDVMGLDPSALLRALMVAFGVEEAT